ncbi:MAG TPA: DNA-3-methyladenine glycosylase [Longimicrobiaceae bacterium]|nr:DNA-3-methyladenine glycosylase [Longimicrobiaceae bacterium]
MTEPRLSRAAEAAARHLCEVDPILRRIIERVGFLEYPLESDLWRALVGSIVGQQLSVAAARTIRGRVAALGRHGFPPAEEILAASEERLRQCGLSRAKAIYIGDLARRWSAGEIDPAEIDSLDDEAVIDRLVRVKGVGRWTAEMVLMFSLGRPDVLSVDDLGIRNAAQRAYALAQRPDRPTLESLAEPWKPFRSYACLYLWRSLEAVPTDDQTG